MQRLKERNHHVDLQILDNEASAEYKKLMTEKWNVNYQLVPPHIHCRNAEERAIRTFKAHFLSILAGVADDFSRNLWDLLIPQIARKVICNAYQDGQEVSFEGSNSSLCCILAMNMGWYQLVIHVLCLRHELLVLRTCLIVILISLDTTLVEKVPQ